MKKGFTLIELMVVVLIIGILSAIALPQYTKAIEKARVAEALSVMDGAKKAIDLYLLENGYPGEGENYAEFIGDMEKSNNISTLGVIDAQNDLTCNGDDCQGKYYGFDAYCWEASCYINAWALKGSHQLSMEKPKGSRTWTKRCWGNPQLCDQLEAQGWD